MRGSDPNTVAADAFSLLGLSPDAGAVDIKLALRRLAKEHHPDLGGDPDLMKAANAAAATAFRSLTSPDPAPSDEPKRNPSAMKLFDDGRTTDIASFTIEALPVEAFEALLIAAACMGEVIDDDPPYRLEAILRNPISCWCRLEVVPDAGSSTVSLAVGLVDDLPAGPSRPAVDDVRNIWVDMLNQLDWT